MRNFSDSIKIIRSGSLDSSLIRDGRGQTVFCLIMFLVMALCLSAGIGGQTALFFFLLFPLLLLAFGGLFRGGITCLILILLMLLCFRFLGFQNFFEDASFLTGPVIYTLIFLVSSIMAFEIIYFYKRESFREMNLASANRQRMENNYKRFFNLSAQTIRSISNAVDARDNYTRRHSARVSDYSVLIAQALGWEEERTEELRSIALLHDIGKIGISDSILNKKDRLTEEETEQVRQHTVIGAEILKDLTLIPNASLGALMHHEWYNGEGYPYRLKGDQIPIEARIIGIADAFDAMNSSRVYRTKMSSEKIMQELKNGRGTQFDPELLDAFLPIAEKLLYSDPSGSGALF